MVFHFDQLNEELKKSCTNLTLQENCLQTVEVEKNATLIESSEKQVVTLLLGEAMVLAVNPKCGQLSGFANLSRNAINSSRVFSKTSCKKSNLVQN
jgi:hypothetical protein